MIECEISWGMEEMSKNSNNTGIGIYFIQFNQTTTGAIIHALCGQADESVFGLEIYILSGKPGRKGRCLTDQLQS